MLHARPGQASFDCQRGRDDQVAEYGYVMLTVRAVEHEFELVRVSADASEVVARYTRPHEAIRRWNQPKSDIRAHARTRTVK